MKKQEYSENSGNPDSLDSSHPRTPDRGAGSAAGLDARRCDAGIAALFQGSATKQTDSPRANPPMGGVSGWELDNTSYSNQSTHRLHDNAGRRIELACEMAEAGVMMMQEKIRRRHPGLDSEEVARRVHEWLQERPGAEHGDAVGRPIHVLGADESDQPR